MSEHFKNFSLLPITTCMCWDCIDSIDTGKPAIHSDSQSQKACCRDCQWMCCPLTLIFDIVSLPFRGIYSCTKYSYEKCTDCKDGKGCVCTSTLEHATRNECSTHTKAISCQPIKDNDKNIINTVPK
jgi:hypothetical protein